MKIYQQVCQPKFDLCLLLCAGVLILSTGCATVRGFGRDVERTGENIQTSAH